MENVKLKVTQDNVRKLLKAVKYNNNKCGTKQASKNGKTENTASDIRPTTAVYQSCDEENIISLNDVDLSDDQTWLYVPEISRDGNRCEVEDLLGLEGKSPNECPEKNS